jgi:hypothetical protein
MLRLFLVYHDSLEHPIQYMHMHAVNGIVVVLMHMSAGPVNLTTSLPAMAHVAPPMVL